MSGQEDAFIFALGCYALLAAFVGGWGALILGTAVNAFLRGHNVKQAITPLLDEL